MLRLGRRERCRSVDRRRRLRGAGTCAGPCALPLHDRAGDTGVAATPPKLIAPRPCWPTSRRELRYAWPGAVIGRRRRTSPGTARCCAALRPWSSTEWTSTRCSSRPAQQAAGQVVLVHADVEVGRSNAVVRTRHDATDRPAGVRRNARCGAGVRCGPRARPSRGQSARCCWGKAEQVGMPHSTVSRPRSSTRARACSSVDRSAPSRR